MLNLILKIAVSIDYYKLSWTKGKGKNPNVRTILKQNTLFQSRKTYQFGIKQISFFHYFLTIWWKQFLCQCFLTSFLHPVSVITHVTRPWWNTVVFPVISRFSWSMSLILFFKLYSVMYLKVVSLPTFTSLDFYRSLVHNNSTEFADNFLFCGDLMSPGS